MKTTTATAFAAFTGLILLAQSVAAEEPAGKKFDFQRYIDKYAGSASSDGGSVKAEVEKIAKNLPKLDNVKIRGSDKFCAEEKSGDESTGDWRAIARRYACPK